MSSPEETVVTYFSKLNGSDAEGLSALFTEDGDFMGNGVPTASGRDNIRSFALAAFQAATHHHDYGIDRVERSETVAAVQTHSVGTVTPTGGGEATSSTHRSLFVLRRAGDEWRIAEYMYNSV